VARRGLTLLRSLLPHRVGGRVLHGAVRDDAPLLDEDLLRQLQWLSLTSRTALTDWLLGGHPGRRKTQSLEFADYRGYVPGDDLRLIDWNAYARLNELFVRTSQAEEAITLSLLVDCSRSMDWGHPNKLRYTKQLVALLGTLALLQSDGVRLFALGDGLAAPGALLRGPDALPRLVDELETLPVFGRTDLPASLDAVRRLGDQHSVAVLISDFWASLGQDLGLALLPAAGTVSVAVHVVDPAEALPQARGTFALRDQETGEQVLLTLTPAVRRRYLERYAAHAQALADACVSHGMRYERIQTDIPPLEAVIELLHGEHAALG
jgi:uncharacterized protein (DUF58 family)